MNATTRKPFDLEAAKAGAPLVTRDGREVTELHHFVTERTPYPVCAIIDGGVSWFNVDGIHTNECERDLFMAKVEPLPQIEPAVFTLVPSSGADAEFRDKLIKDLAFRLMPDGWPADKVMDAVTTIMQRRKAI